MIVPHFASEMTYIVSGGVLKSTHSPDCPTWSTSPLLCDLYHSEGAFHCNARFDITLILLGSQNERYNEVAV